MNWYNNYKNELKEIIETVAREEKRSNIIVEKDLIQSLFLYELSNTDLPFVGLVERVGSNKTGYWKMK